MRRAEKTAHGDFLGMFQGMKKNLPWVHAGYGTIQMLLIEVQSAHPRDCECDQPLVRAVPASFPQPEGRATFPSVMIERVTSAASDGSAVVYPGAGELKLKGYAPTVLVST
jgi:hypothetical protein